MSKTHGFGGKRTRTRTYGIWAGMLTRVRNRNRKDAEHYVGRGIDVDPRWERFENFLADMGECPPGLTIERKDNDRGYWPDNCEWQEKGKQRRNTRHCVWVALQGEKMLVVDALAKVNSNWGYYRTLRWGKWSRMSAQEAIDYLAARPSRTKD